MPILGYFVYRDLGDGVIASKYSNLRKERLFSESATKTVTHLAEPDHAFLGSFDATWIDAVNPAVSGQATLRITRKPNSNSQFILHWTDPFNGQPIFLGEGMLHDGILIGAYWNPTIESISNLHTIIP